MSRRCRPARFDSMTGLLRALGAALREEPLPAVGALPPAVAPLVGRAAQAAGLFPRSWRDAIYRRGGALEACSKAQLDALDGEAFARSMVSAYPDRTYPGVAIGAASGAAVHLCAALGIPWLPQTFLCAVRAPELDVDDAEGPMLWGRAAAAVALRNNPELALHHMRDPNHDRRMLAELTYFRFKRRRLGAAFTRFIRDRVRPGGFILLQACSREWPVTHVDERHYYQFGALGGASEGEYHRGGPRVAAFLRRARVTHIRWRPPSPDLLAPEAEWGFDDALLPDVWRIAREMNLTVLRLSFDEPDDLSPLVADLDLERRRTPEAHPGRLLVESSLLMAPERAARLGLTPFWMLFNAERSLSRLERFLADRTPFEDILLTLFQHGVDSVGQVAIDRWCTTLGKSWHGGRMVGVNPELHPRDFAVYVEFDRALEALERASPRAGRLGPLPFRRLLAFLDGRRTWPGVRITVHPPGGEDAYAPSFAG